jgi:hypothetical protein
MPHGAQCGCDCCCMMLGTLSMVSTTAITAITAIAAVGNS